MFTFIKSSLVLILMVNIVLTHKEESEKKPAYTLSDYKKGSAYAHRVELNREILNAEVNRSPAVEPFNQTLAVEDFSNYRKPAVMPNY